MNRIFLSYPTLRRIDYIETPTFSISNPFDQYCEEIIYTTDQEWSSLFKDGSDYSEWGISTVEPNKVWYLDQHLTYNYDYLTNEKYNFDKIPDINCFYFLQKTLNTKMPIHRLETFIRNFRLYNSTGRRKNETYKPYNLNYRGKVVGKSREQGYKNFFIGIDTENETTADLYGEQKIVTGITGKDYHFINIVDQPARYAFQRSIVQDARMVDNSAQVLPIALIGYYGGLIPCGKTYYALHCFFVCVDNLQENKRIQRSNF